MWYVIHPEGCSWIAINTKTGELIEQANSETHIKAKDKFSSVCEDIQDYRTTETLLEEGTMVVRFYNKITGNDLNPDKCIIDAVEI